MSPVMMAVFGGVMLLAFVVMLVLNDIANKRKVNARIERLKQRKVTMVKTSANPTASLRKTKKETPPIVELLMKPLPDMTRLDNRLIRAGFNINAKQFMFRSLAVVLMCAFGFLAIGKSPIIGLSIGIIIGFWMPMAIVKRRIYKQLQSFLKIFPEGIDLIVRGLRSGLPVSESMAMVASEVADPVGSTFRHVSDSMKLGVSMEKALQEMADKMDCTDFNFFVTSIVLQRETGGNLSEILSNLSDVLRKRYMMKMKIHSMTSEARASAWIVGLLPFFVAGAVMFMSPKYLTPLWSDYRGNYALLGAFGMLGMGIMTMRRMSRFEI